MTKIAFFHCAGTSNLGPFGIINAIGQVVNPILELIGVVKPASLYTVAGINGRSAAWNLTPPGDPFPALLDPNVWNARKIAYPAAALPIGQSIRDGVANVIAAINALPAGQPFALGGYSQGACVISTVYNEIRSGSLTSRAGSFLGGICYGNPRRQLNYRGSVGGTWSGSLFNPTATTGSGGGFPTSGEFARLTGCDPLKWVEFTHPSDIFCSVGSTEKEQKLTQFLTLVTDLANPAAVAEFAFNFAGLVGNVLDVAGQVTAPITTVDANGVEFDCPGGGHMQYAFVPPPGDPDNGLTSYQIALKFLESKAAEWATAPIVLPETPISPANAGWSTTLIPPAA